MFQCSSASRKFLNVGTLLRPRHDTMCFSALQRAENSSICPFRCSLMSTPLRFSALQRAENSSMHVDLLAAESPRFQCSSASRKFLNTSARKVFATRSRFQCSSASRKFLNAIPVIAAIIPQGFSALQRAENSSISCWFCPYRSTGSRFSALQRAENSSIVALDAYTPVLVDVSVLFSEPKIPQSDRSHNF